MSRNRRWIYLLPALHLCACLIGLVGYLLPNVQFLGMVFDFVFVADYPISFIAWLFAWNNPSFIVLQTVLGTFLCYLLIRRVQALLFIFQLKNTTLALSI